MFKEVLAIYIQWFTITFWTLSIQNTVDWKSNPLLLLYILIKSNQIILTFIIRNFIKESRQSWILLGLIKGFFSRISRIRIKFFFREGRVWVKAHRSRTLRYTYITRGLCTANTSHPTRDEDPDPTCKRNEEKNMLGR